MAWPLAVRAQQPGMPVIGFLDVRSPDELGVRLGAFHQGLKESGFAEGDNVSILYRFAENRSDRLAELVGDLVQRKVAVIATAGPSSAFAARAATTNGFRSTRAKTCCAALRWKHQGEPDEQFPMEGYKLHRCPPLRCIRPVNFSNCRDANGRDEN
jgi:hypothetical protein